MAKAKTPKQLEISIRSLKRKIALLEVQKKRAVTAKKKKPAKKKRVVKRKVAKRKPAKRKTVKKKKRR